MGSAAVRKKEDDALKANKLKNEKQVTSLIQAAFPPFRP